IPNRARAQFFLILAPTGRRLSACSMPCLLTRIYMNDPHRLFRWTALSFYKHDVRSSAHPATITSLNTSQHGCHCNMLHH
ncbi:hypothetical protein B0H17DRAFT_1097458, partial [Mycena rosella]